MKNTAVVVCLHGNETLGLEVANRFKEEMPVFIGNPQAIEKGVRCLDSDLNRVFPGDEDGNIEEKRAIYLLNQLKFFECIVDIHSSSGDTDLFGIITKPNKEKVILAEKLGLDKLVIMSEKFASGKALIDHVSCGISLEIGPHKKREIVDKISQALNNLKDGIGQNDKHMKTYEVIEVIPAEDDADVFIANFCKVRKGDLIAKGEKEHFADKDFIPIFVNEKAYKNILCLACKEINVEDLF